MKDVLDYDLIKKPKRKDTRVVIVLYYIYCLTVSQHIIYSIISFIGMNFTISFFILFQCLFILTSLLFITISISYRITKLSYLTLSFSVFMLIILLFI